MTHRPAPIIRIENVYRRDGSQSLSLVVICPACDREHRHGAGESILTAHQHLGARAAHCPRGVTYDLTDSNGLLPGSRAA